MSATVGHCFLVNIASAKGGRGAQFETKFFFFLEDKANSTE